VLLIFWFVRMMFTVGSYVYSTRVSSDSLSVYKLSHRIGTCTVFRRYVPVYDVLA